MAGTLAGGKKAAETNLKKDPDFYKKIGSKGGKNSSGYVFGHGKVDPSEIGRIGGRNGKRNYNK